MKNMRYDSKKAERSGKPVQKPGRQVSAKKAPFNAAPRKNTAAEPRKQYTGGLQIEGRNAILEALRAGAGITALYLQEGLGGAEIEEIRSLSEKAGVIPQTVKSERLQSLQESKNPQGVVAKFREYRFYDIDDMLRDAKDRAAGVTPAVAKSSAGALFRMKVAEVTNIAATLDKLKKEGLWTACADMDGERPENCDLRGPLALVIGAEGDGVPRLVREKCDMVISIPMVQKGTVDSLNASVAAGILMYEITRQRAR